MAGKTAGIKSWPQDDRPREKLLKKGAGALSNSELLAILLRTGVKGNSAIDLARKMLAKFGTFRNMSHTDAREWEEFKGLGPAKIAQIKAALEIGKRFREDEVLPAKQKIATAKEVVDIIMPQMRDLKTEVFKVVYLNSNNKIIDIADAAYGTVNQAAPIVREIIHSALQKFAAAIICVHNHPSANIAPSAEDKKITGELSAAAKLLGIRMLDHIIIGDGNYFSFADEGVMG
ncbi:MAG: DNA repair protein RadC [Smithellaceae bacterium]|jgi:DNA repair protein RadC|nr:DNA repair protein RadC [Syntrophaceae bacterium]NMD05554.1 DNA repair protein RadC [Deltaproteobacteria bacterium]